MRASQGWVASPFALLLAALAQLACGCGGSDEGLAAPSPGEDATPGSAARDAGAEVLEDAADATLPIDADAADATMPPGDGDATPTGDDGSARDDADAPSEASEPDAGRDGGADATDDPDAGGGLDAGVDSADAAIVCRPGEVLEGGQCTLSDPVDPKSCLTGGNVLVLAENGYPAHRVQPVESWIVYPEQMVPNPTSIGVSIQTTNGAISSWMYNVTLADDWALSTGTYVTSPGASFPSVAFEGTCFCSGSPGWFVVHELATTGDVTDASLRRFTATFEENCGPCGRVRGCVHYEQPGDAGAPNSNGTGHDGGAAVEPVFQAYTRVDVPGMYFPFGIAIGDVTGDGRGDVVVGGSDNSGVNPALYVVASTSSGTFAVAQKIALGQGAQLSNTPIRVGDVTGDGLADVVMPLSPGVVVYPQLKGGGLGAPIALSQPVSPARIDNLELFDVDRDKHLDVLALEYDSALLALVYRGRASDVPAPAVPYPTNGGIVRAGDVTGDGLPDLVALSQGSGLWVHAQAKDGSFTPPSAAVPVTGYDEAIGDVTGDGLADVVMTAGGSPPNASVLVLAQKSGALLAPVSYATLDSPQAPVLVDADGDGRLDVLVLHYGFDAFGLLRQRPDGTLDAEELFPIDNLTSGHTSSLAIGDATGDGQVDVATAIDGAILLSPHRR